MSKNAERLDLAMKLAERGLLLSEIFDRIAPHPRLQRLIRESLPHWLHLGGKSGESWTTKCETCGETIAAAVSTPTWDAEQPDGWAILRGRIAVHHSKEHSLSPRKIELLRSRLLDGVWEWKVRTWG